MKYATPLFGLLATALGKEIPKDPQRAADLYDSGLMHEKIMSLKELFWAQELKAGRYAEQWPELAFAQCKDGKAIPFRDQPTNFYRCKNVTSSPLYNRAAWKKIFTHLFTDQPSPLSLSSGPWKLGWSGFVILGLGFGRWPRVCDHRSGRWSCLCRGM
jgi:hypothetical protein